MPRFLNTLSFILAVGFATLGCLKLVTTGGAIWWLRHHGRTYRKALSQNPPGELNGKAIRKIVEQCFGQRVWPWGVLDYRLYRKGRLLRLFGRWVYRLVTLGSAALIVYMLLYRFNLCGRNAAAWSSVALIFQVCVMFTALEGVFAYIAIGNYRKHYHVGMRLRDDATPNADDGMYEIDVLLPLVTSAVVVNVFAFVTSQSGWCAFHIPDDATNSAPLLLQALYFVSTTLITVGYGDIYPKTSLGQVVAILMHAQSLLLIVGVFSSLLSFGLKADDNTD